MKLRAVRFGLAWDLHAVLIDIHISAILKRVICIAYIGIVLNGSCVITLDYIRKLCSSFGIIRKLRRQLILGVHWYYVCRAH